MWIEIYKAKKSVLINTDLLGIIDVLDEQLKILLVMNGGGGIELAAHTIEELNALYTGIILALNGLDFIIEESENECAGYIKPLLQSKNEALYKYMLYKEAISPIERSLKGKL